MSYFHHTVKKGRIQNKGNKGRIQNKGNKIYHFCFLHYIYFYFVVWVTTKNVFKIRNKMTEIYHRWNIFLWGFI
jgi:hypothetical protein